MGLLSLTILLAVYLAHRTGVLEVDFPIRRALRLRRGKVVLKGESKESLFDSTTLDLVGRLESDYALGDWSSVSARDVYAASLFYLHLVETCLRHAQVQLPQQIRAVDVGVSDWFYVRPLYAYLSAHGRDVQMDGLEIDAYRIYRNLHTRIDWAEAFVGDTPNCRYHVVDALEFETEVDVAFMFFPFIFRTDHAQWGLPRAQLQPEKLLAHVFEWVKPGGILLIVNQGVAEFEAQSETLAKLNIPVLWAGPHASGLFDFELQRYVSVAQKPGDRSENQNASTSF